MRALWLTPLLLSFACANGSHTSMDEQPSWQGPPVVAHHLDNGDLRLTMTVPTAGYALDVVDAQRDGEHGEVYLRLQTPTGDLVAQVLTELRVLVPAADLEGVHQVRVSVARDREQARLALTTSRP